MRSDVIEHTIELITRFLATIHRYLVDNQQILLISVPKFSRVFREFTDHIRVAILPLKRGIIVTNDYSVKGGRRAMENVFRCRALAGTAPTRKDKSSWMRRKSRCQSLISILITMMPDFVGVRNSQHREPFNSYPI